MESGNFFVKIIKDSSKISSMDMSVIIWIKFVLSYRV